MGISAKIRLGLFFAVALPLVAQAGVTDISVGTSGVVLDDFGPGLGATALARARFDVFGTLEVNANGDVVISTKDLGGELPKANIDVEAVFGLDSDGNMRESSVRIMRGVVVRGRYQRDVSIDVQDAEYLGAGYAFDTDVDRTLGFKFRAMLEAGQAANSHDRYLVVQARGEGTAYVCKGLDPDARKAVCATLGAALGLGYAQSAIEGKAGVDYRYSLTDDHRIFINEVRVGTYASGVLQLDRDGFNRGGQVGLGLEIR